MDMRTAAGSRYTLNTPTESKTARKEQKITFNSQQYARNVQMKNVNNMPNSNSLK